MQLRTFAMVASAVTLAGSAAAQGTTPVQGPHLDGKTPAECMKGASDWRTKTWIAQGSSRTTQSMAVVSTEAQRIAKECGAQFTFENTPPAALGGLIDFYTFIGDTAAARSAVGRALLNNSLTPRARATALTKAMTQEIANANGYFGILDGAEAYVKQIDALPDSLDDVKISAHSTMLSRYEYLDVDPGLQNHALALIALGRKHENRGLPMAFMGLARAAADMLHPDSALRILDAAEKELGMTPQAASEFKSFRDRYALIGTKAPPVTGQWWVNSNSTDAVQPGNGKVTLIEFTAHWCMPCKNSYPGLRELAKHFAGKPFEGVMATNLYGYLGERRPLTPAQEVEADRDYFAKEHELPFKVAINTLRPPTRPGAPQPGDLTPVLDQLYRVGGIPQIMIVDKHGVIRQIVTGWDHGNTERFTKYIEGLINER